MHQEPNIPGAPLKKKPLNKRAPTKVARRILPKSIKSMTRKELQEAASGGRLKAFGVTGNSSSEEIRRALRKKRKSKYR